MRCLIFACLVLFALLDGSAAEPLPPGGWRYDANGDGVIGGQDLFHFLSLWGKGEKSPPVITPQMVDVPAGTFTMGRRDDGDDYLYGDDNELPPHLVNLTAYQIGKFEVTNAQYAAVLNWALGQGFVQGPTGGADPGGNVYAYGKILLELVSGYCQIDYLNGVFVSRTREGYSMADHPVVMVSWYGAVAFCNWLSMKEGRAFCYTPDTWELTNRFGGGYRLPTEAEWERAAAWDASKHQDPMIPGIGPIVIRHYIYGFWSDTLSGAGRCNYGTGYFDGSNVNPLGLTSVPYTSPVGWFNGTNVNPHGIIPTIDSQSPAGCYDMSGNVWEWCQDRYQSDYYGTPGASTTNPICENAASKWRVWRGGSYNSSVGCRSAFRIYASPDNTLPERGFRVARTL